jgi:hypothetical protein
LDVVMNTGNPPGRIQASKFERTVIIIISLMKASEQKMKEL